MISLIFLFDIHDISISLIFQRVRSSTTSTTASPGLIRERPFSGVLCLRYASLTILCLWMSTYPSHSAVPSNSCRFHFSRFLNLQAGDKITITFDPAVALTSFRLVSGNAEHPSDRFFNTTIEVPCFVFVYLPSWFVFNEYHRRWCLPRLASKNSNLWAVSTSLAWQRAPCPPHLVPWPNLD